MVTIGSTMASALDRGLGQCEAALRVAHAWRRRYWTRDGLDLQDAGELKAYF
jgi:hypothetical protein